MKFSRTKKGYRLEIAPGSTIKEPIHIVFGQEDCDETLNNTIIAEEDSEITILEEYTSNINLECRTEMICKSNAKINYYKIQNQDKSASHSAQTFIKQSKDSVVNHFSLSLGGKANQETISVSLSETGSACQLLGFYTLSEDNQSSEHSLKVDHLANHSQSNMFYKGILNNKSKACFTGKVYVHPDTQKVEAVQANHNLLLSSNAEAISKPELEIYADDVKCKHGATVGQLDEEALFYLRSRGIDEASAKQFLLAAYAEDVISHINHAKAFEYISNAVNNHVKY